MHLGFKHPASLSPRTSPAGLIFGYSWFCVNYGIGVLSHATFKCCAHLPTCPLITPSLLRILFLDQRDSAPTLLKRPQLTRTRVTTSNPENDAHRPRKATPVDFTHQTHAHLLFPSRWTSRTFIAGRTSSIDREDPLCPVHPVSGISEVVRTS